MTPESLRARCVSRGPGAGIFGERTARMMLDAADRIEALEAQLAAALASAAAWEEACGLELGIGQRLASIRHAAERIRGMKTP